MCQVCMQWNSSTWQVIPSYCSFSVRSASCLVVLSVLMMAKCVKKSCHILLISKHATFLSISKIVPARKPSSMASSIYSYTIKELDLHVGQKKGSSWTNLTTDTHLDSLQQQSSTKYTLLQQVHITAASTHYSFIQVLQGELLKTYPLSMHASALSIHEPHTQTPTHAS